MPLHPSSILTDAPSFLTLYGSIWKVLKNRAWKKLEGVDKDIRQRLELLEHTKESIGIPDFDTLDVNKDGVIDRAEYMLAMRHKAVDQVEPYTSPDRILVRQASSSPVNAEAVEPLEDRLRYLYSKPSHRISGF